jgi:hypothetical protein
MYLLDLVESRTIRVPIHKTDVRIELQNIIAIVAKRLANKLQYDLTFINLLPDSGSNWRLGLHR